MEEGSSAELETWQLYILQNMIFIWNWINPSNYNLPNCACVPHVSITILLVFLDEVDDDATHENEIKNVFC